MRFNYIRKHTSPLPGDLGEDARVYVSEDNRYTVLVSQVGEVHPKLGRLIHLSIRRDDRSKIRDWRELQEIKTAILGPDAEAVEIFPAEGRVMDTCNQYHLWSWSKGRLLSGYECGRAVIPDDQQDVMHRLFNARGRGGFEAMNAVMELDTHTGAIRLKDADGNEIDPDTLDMETT